MPVWLTALAWVSLGLAVLCAALVLHDVFGRGYRQHMRIMEVVWPVTALYFGPLALWAYRRWGRPMSHKWMEEHGDPPKKSQAATTAVGTSHCGAGCTLGDIIGSPLVVFVLGWQIAGMYLYAEYVVDYALAFVLGIAFQYYSIKPMRDLPPREGLVAALKADFLSLTSFQVGLLRVDGRDAARAVPRRHPPRPRGVLVSHAGRHDPGVRDLLPGQLVAYPPRDQGGDVTTRRRGA